jgi:hypothetical protein
MAATQQQLKEIEAGRKTGKGKNSRTQQQAKAVGTDHALQTRRAARANPKEIAVMLSQKALAGDLASAKLLFKMANSARPTEPAKKKRHGLTFAQQLELDSPWQGDPEQDFLQEDEPPTKPE